MSLESRQILRRNSQLKFINCTPCPTVFQMFFSLKGFLKFVNNKDKISLSYLLEYNKAKENDPFGQILRIKTKFD